MRRFTRGSQTGPVPNNTHSHLHNPSIPKGKRGGEAECQAEGEKRQERGGNEKRIAEWREGDRVKKGNTENKGCKEENNQERNEWDGLDKAREWN